MSTNRFVARGWLEGCVVVGTVRERARERVTVGDRRNSNRTKATHRRTFTWAKLERGKKSFD